MRPDPVAILLLQLLGVVQGFSIGPLRSNVGSAVRSPRPWVLYDATIGVESDATNAAATILSTEILQSQLISLGASYNRGFGASSRARAQVGEIIQRLEAKNEERFAARGIGGSTESPLAGAWRMVWTTALDVLSLEANPLATTGAIYQVFDPPVITNVIDLLPRIQSLLPPSLVPGSLLRANVQTRAYERANKPNRIGLEFQSVQLQPVQALGMDVKDLLPPLGLDLPRLPGMAQDENGPGYFDVTFLDDKFLIIRQQGDGLFCLVKVDSIDP